MQPLNPAWAAARRVLAVRADGLGDLLMTTPALAALKASLPQATLTLLASPAGAAAASHLPMLDAVWSCEPSWTHAGVAAGATTTAAHAHVGNAERALVRRIAQGRFDAAVVFTVCTQSAWPAVTLLRLAGVPLVLAHGRENVYGLLSDRVPDPDRVERDDAAALAGRAAPPVRHEVRRQLDLVATIGASTADEGLRFALRQRDRDAMRARLATAVAAAPARPDGSRMRLQRPWVVVHPGASAPSRRWPPERFGRVAGMLALHGWPIVFAGDEAEVGFVDAARRELALVAPEADAVSLAGELPLSELAALIEGAALVIANNSAPMHLAAALGTPVVALYALTNPQHGPWNVPAITLSHDVPCRNCLKSRCPEGHHRCLRGVSEADALAAALALLAETPAEPMRRRPPATATTAPREALA